MTEPARPSLIRSNRTFRWYWTGRMLSLVGDGVATIALVFYVQSFEGTGVAVAGLLLAQGLPRLLGPLTGALADRHDQRRLMLRCDLGQAALYALVAILLPGYAVLLALVTAASVLQTLFAPAGRAAVPAMVGQDRLLRANVWLGSATNLQVAAGPLLGGLLIAAGGTRLALAVNALSFLASAACLWRMPSLPTVRRPPDRGVLAATWDGLAYVVRDPITRPVTLMILGCSAFLAIDGVTLVFLTRDTLNATPAEYGITASAFGAGMVAMSVAALARESRRSPALLLIAALVVGAAGTAATGLAPALALAIAFQAVTGVGNGLENIASDTLIQSRVATSVIGRVFGVVTTVAFAATSLSAVVAGALVDIVGPRTVFVGAGIGTFAVVALCAPGVLRERAPRPTPAHF